jgi:hypothetical protein
MYKPCAIVIEYETREKLKDIAKKSQTYTQILNELIEFKQTQRKGQN